MNTQHMLPSFLSFLLISSAVRPAVVFVVFVHVVLPELCVFSAALTVGESFVQQVSLLHEEAHADVELVLFSLSVQFIRNAWLNSVSLIQQ